MNPPETNPATKIFAENFRRVLAAKNLPLESDKIVNLLTKWDSKINLTDGALSCWLWGNSLPRYSTFEMLARWLDCDKTELLPAEYWGLMKGYDDSLNQ